MFKCPFVADNEIADFHAKMNSKYITSAVVSAVDADKQRIAVSSAAQGKRRTPADWVSIGNMFADCGFGMRIMPVAGKTNINFFEDTFGHRYHIGYDLTNLETITDSASGEKQDTSPNVLIRRLEEGEAHISALPGNEILLSIDGGILIKSQYGSFIKLDNYLNRLEGSFSNVLYEGDGVRWRMGNVIRPTRSDTTEDQYMVRDELLNVVGMDTLAYGAVWSPIKEFSFRVGTVQDLDNAYRDYVDKAISPSVGEFAMADIVVDESGLGEFRASEPVQCKLRLQNGAGFLITQGGSFYLNDEITFNPIKFDNSVTNAERSLRIRDNYISISSIDPNTPGGSETPKWLTEIAIGHESNSKIELNNLGNVRIQETSGRYFVLDDFGATLNVTDRVASIIAKDIKLLADNVTIGGSANVPMIDRLLKITQFSTLYDLFVTAVCSHVHTGPTGPPAPPLGPVITPTFSLSDKTLIPQSLYSTNYLMST
jgi:hypothetical protein